MKKYFSFLVVLLFFVVACNNTSTKTEETISSLGKFDQNPTQFNGNAENAFQQLESAINKFTADRNPDGSLNRANAPTLISHILGIFQQFPKDEKTAKIGFRTAELLTYANEHQNAARIFHLISTSFPKSEQVGQAQLQLGIILDKNLSNQDGAINTYRLFIKDYPNHPLVGTAEGLLYELVR